MGNPAEVEKAWINRLLRMAARPMSEEDMKAALTRSKVLDNLPYFEAALNELTEEGFVVRRNDMILFPEWSERKFMDVKLPPLVAVEVDEKAPYEQYKVVHNGSYIGTLTPERDTIEARGGDFRLIGEFETDQEAMDAILREEGISTV
jgi:hypothetical protein